MPPLKFRNGLVISPHTLLGMWLLIHAESPWNWLFLPKYSCLTTTCVKTHWGRDKMDAVSQSKFSRAFSSMKIVVFWLNFHWNMFPRIKLTIIQHWFRYWLGADQATSHYLNQWWLFYRRIYASLGLNELKYHGKVLSSPCYVCLMANPSLKYLKTL